MVVIEVNMLIRSALRAMAEMGCGGNMRAGPGMGAGRVGNVTVTSGLAQGHVLMLSVCSAE